MQADIITHFWLGIRSITMTVLFPGVVVGLIPFGFILQQNIPEFGSWTILHISATLVFLIGLAVLLRSIWEFAYVGRGTLAPFDEPDKLVIQGLYKYVRNPMYVGVYLVLLGESWFFWSSGVLIWAGIFFIASNIAVIAFEEPRLKKKYGVEYEEYNSRVRRWIPGKAYYQ